MFMTLLDNHHVAYPDLQLFPPKCMGCRYHNTPLDDQRVPCASVSCKCFLTLWAWCAYIYIYICTHVPTTHRDARVCMHAVQTSAYHALSYTVKQDCGVNPCLFSSNNSRPHLSTYITTRRRPEGAVLVREWSWILTRAAKYEAFSRMKGGNDL